MNNALIRTVLLILHALLNFFIISYIMDFDITGSWLRLLLFVLLLLILLYFFIIHALYYTKLLKSK